jgi:hypothetical protein
MTAPLVKKAMSFNEEFGGGGERWTSFRKWNCEGKKVRCIVPWEGVRH